MHVLVASGPVFTSNNFSHLNCPRMPRLALMRAKLFVPVKFKVLKLFAKFGWFMKLKNSLAEFQCVLSEVGIA